MTEKLVVPKKLCLQFKFEVKLFFDFVLNKLDKRIEVFGGGLTLIGEDVGMLGSDLGISNAGTFKIKLLIDDPAG